MPQAIYDYHYGIEAEQYAFFRIPKVLMTEPHFRGISTDAKLLYGLMLDRMSLSVKNGWLDDNERVYYHSLCRADRNADLYAHRLYGSHRQPVLCR